MPLSGDNRDHYEILGVPRNASDEDIRKAYLGLARKYHPDANPGFPQDAKAKMVKIIEAKEVLLDKEKRRMYDGDLSQNVAGVDGSWWAERDRRAAEDTERRRRAEWDRRVAAEAERARAEDAERRQQAYQDRQAAAGYRIFRDYVKDNHDYCAGLSHREKKDLLLWASQETGAGTGALLMAFEEALRETAWARRGWKAAVKKAAKALGRRVRNFLPRP